MEIDGQLFDKVYDLRCGCANRIKEITLKLEHKVKLIYEENSSIGVGWHLDSNGVNDIVDVFEQL